MRMIYSSPRIENIDRMVAVMAEHGIATRVTNRRAYDRSSYSRFSYARPGDSTNWPAVWVTHANDHSRARQLMRQIGIEPSTRYADELAAYRRQRGTRSPVRVAAIIRIALLIALCAAAALYGARLISVG